MSRDRGASRKSVGSFRGAAAFTLRYVAVTAVLAVAAFVGEVAYWSVKGPEVDARYVRPGPVIVARDLLLPEGLAITGQGGLVAALAGHTEGWSEIAVFARDGNAVRYQVPARYAEGVAVSPSGEIVTADGGPNAAVYRIRDGNVSRQEVPNLHYAVALAFDKQGDLLAESSEPRRLRNSEIIRITPDGDARVVYDGLFGIAAIAVNDAGEVVVVGYTRRFGDAPLGVVVQIDPYGVTRLLASGIDQPQALAMDAAGNLYVASFGSGGWHLMLYGPLPLAVPRGYVVRIGKDGTVRKVIDNLNNPSGLAIDRDGNLYVSVDYSKILKFTLVDVGGEALR